MSSRHIHRTPKGIFGGFLIGSFLGAFAGLDIFGAFVGLGVGIAVASAVFFTDERSFID